jgi:hypothetical protein
LRKDFESRNKTHPYPKERGKWRSAAWQRPVRIIARSLGGDELLIGCSIILLPQPQSWQFQLLP